MSDYVRRAVASSLETILPIGNSDRLYKLGMSHLPYLIHPIFNGTKYIVLNRDYKPLGVGKSKGIIDDYVQYQRPDFSSLWLDARDIDFSVFSGEQKISGCFYFCTGLVTSKKDVPEYVAKVIKALKIG